MFQPPIEVRLELRLGALRMFWMFVLHFDMFPCVCAIFSFFPQAILLLYSFCVGRASYNDYSSRAR